MTDLSLALVAGTYPDVASVAADYDVLKAAQKEEEDFAVVGAVVVGRDTEGAVTVHEHGAASPVGGSAVLGGGAGLVIGLFARPLLLATAVVDDTYADRSEPSRTRRRRSTRPSTREASPSCRRPSTTPPRTSARQSTPDRRLTPTTAVHRAHSPRRGRPMAGRRSLATRRHVVD